MTSFLSFSLPHTAAELRLLRSSCIRATHTSPVWCTHDTPAWNPSSWEEEAGELGWEGLPQLRSNLKMTLPCMRPHFKAACSSFAPSQDPLREAESWRVLPDRASSPAELFASLMPPTPQDSGLLGVELLEAREAQACLLGKKMAQRKLVKNLPWGKGK